MPNKLSRSYLKHAAIGREALRSLNIGPLQIANGLTHCSFLFTQMEAAATLPIATRVASLLTLPPSTYMRRKGLSRSCQWRSHLASVKGFCYLRLFSIKWVVPALCMLGAYPNADDVACLDAYYCSDFVSWGVYSQGLHRGHQVVHVRGSPRVLSYTVSDKLHTFRGSLVGSSYSNQPSNHGPPPPYSSRPPPYQ